MLTLPGPIPGDGRVLAAFSGGGDSLALLALLKDAGVETVAAIVDHGVQPGSAAQTQAAADQARLLGAPAEVLPLPPTAYGGHARWRRARYAALAACARRHRIGVIALGHTEDDQIETLALRALAGSGLRGLAGMARLAPCPVWPEGRGLWAWRPLLGVRRAALRAWLLAQGLPWHEDPANADPRFARSQIRRRLAEDPAFAAHAAALLAAAPKAAAHAAAEDRAAAALLAEVKIQADGALSAPAAALAGAEGAARATAVLATAAAGREAIAAAPTGMELREGAGGALEGAVWRVRRGMLELDRDARGLDRAPRPLRLGQDLTWDGRFLVRALRPMAAAAAPMPGAARTAPAILAVGGGVVPGPEAVARGWAAVSPLAGERIAQLLFRAHSPFCDEAAQGWGVH